MNMKCKGFGHQNGDTCSDCDLVRAMMQAKNQQAEKRCKCLCHEGFDYHKPRKCHCQPSEEKECNCKNCEPKSSLATNHCFHCPLYNEHAKIDVAPTEAGWKKKLSNLLTKMSEHYLIDEEFEAELKWFIAQVIQEEREKLLRK